MTFLFGRTAYWCYMYEMATFNQYFVFVLLLCIFVQIFLSLVLNCWNIFKYRNVCSLPIRYFLLLHEWEICGLLCHKENKNEMKMINYARNVDIRIEPFVLSPCKNCCLHSMHMICTFSVAIKLHNEEVLWTFFSPIYDECIIFWKYRHNLC